MDGETGSPPALPTPCMPLSCSCCLCTISLRSLATPDLHSTNRRQSQNISRHLIKAHVACWVRLGAWSEWRGGGQSKRSTNKPPTPLLVEQHLEPHTGRMGALDECSCRMHLRILTRRNTFPAAMPHALHGPSSAPAASVPSDCSPSLPCSASCFIRTSLLGEGHSDSCCTTVVLL